MSASKYSFQDANLYALFSDLKKEPVEGFSAGLQGDGSDIYKWQVLILGPPDTP